MGPTCRHRLRRGAPRRKPWMEYGARNKMVRGPHLGGRLSGVLSASGGGIGRVVAATFLTPTCEA
jgi:hypothetical protein